MYPRSLLELADQHENPRNIRQKRLYPIPDKETLLVCTGEKSPVQQINPASRPTPYDNPFSYFCAVVKGIAEEDPQSTLQNNLIVMEILDAAKESASTGK